MAGNWIKIEHVMPDKPEVDELAAILNIDHDAVTGKLVRFWIWADQQINSGHAISVTHSLIDRITFCPGFAEGLIRVGWLEKSDNCFIIPNFERHNGKTAKNRSLANNRKKKERSHSEKCHDDSVTNVTEETVQKRDQRREEKNINNHQSSSARAGARGESPLAASIAAVENIPEAVPVNPAPPQPSRRPSCAEPYPETVEEVEKAMLATTGLRPQGDDLKECAAAYLDNRSIRGWMTKTANPVPIADWRRDCLNFARLWATNNQQTRKTEYSPPSPGTPPHQKSRCGPKTKDSFDWNGGPGPVINVTDEQNHKQQ